MSASKKISELVYRMTKSDMAPSEVQICPECGGTLLVKFAAYDRGYGAIARCDDCDIGLALDFEQKKQIIDVEFELITYQ